MKLTVGQKLTIISISSMLAHTVATRCKVKEAYPEPQDWRDYVNGPVKGKRYGVMTIERGRKQFYLGIEYRNLAFDGWDLPFTVQSEAKRRPEPGMFTTTSFSGNACINLVGKPEVIRDWVENKALLPVPDDAKGILLYHDVDADGYIIDPGTDGALLYPDIEVRHAVIDRIRASRDQRAAIIATEDGVTA